MTFSIRSDIIHLTLSTTSYPGKLIIVAVFAPDLIISNLLTLMIIGILLIVCSFIRIIFANVLCYYIRQVNGVKLADILFSLVCVVCVCICVCVCEHSHRCSQILSSAFLPFPSLPFPSLHLSSPPPSPPFLSPSLPS